LKNPNRQKIKVCTQCGFTWEEFVTRRIFGCVHCYTQFNEELKPFFAQLHGCLLHNPEERSQVRVEVSPQRYEQLAQLRELLSDAVRQERFEDALKIKKDIASLEGTK